VRLAKLHLKFLIFRAHFLLHLDAAQGELNVQKTKLQLYALWTFVGLVSFSAVYFGYLRNEGRCYNTVDADLKKATDTLERWKISPPSYVNRSELQLIEAQMRVAEDGLRASNIKMDPHRSICDYYVYGMRLRRK
jgi:hypothetical protein